MDIKSKIEESRFKIADYKSKIILLRRQISNIETELVGEREALLKYEEEQRILDSKIVK
jgi:hypothetical protein